MNGGDCNDMQPRDCEIDVWGRRLAFVADVIDRRSFPLYSGLIACFMALFIAATFFLTVEADESWILLSTAHAFGVTVPVTEAFGKPTITTGGPHLLLHGLLASVTMNIVLHRFISTIATAILLLVIYKALRGSRHSPGRAIAGTALFATVPGFVLQAGLATGEVIAVLFLIGAGLHWIRRGAFSLPAATMTGFLLGTACATRVNCAAAIGGLVAYAIVAPYPCWQRIGRALAAAAVAVAIAAANAALYYHAGSTPLPSGQDAYVATATGVGGGRKSIFQILQSALLLNEYLPILLLLLVVGMWILRRFDRDQNGASVNSGELAGIMLFIGSAILAAWILFAPIPHLRYLWPALACIWLAGTSLLLDVWARARGSLNRLIVHGFVTMACLYALVTDVFMVGHGESLTLVYRAVGISPRPALPRDAWFRAASDQRALARFVATQPASSSIFTLYASGSYPIVYLSGRSIQNKDRMTDTRGRLLILTPADHAIWQPGGDYFAWKKTYTRPAFRSGDFAALRIDDRARALPRELVPVGMSDIY